MTHTHTYTHTHTPTHTHTHTHTHTNTYTHTHTLTHVTDGHTHIHTHSDEEHPPASSEVLQLKEESLPLTGGAYVHPPEVLQLKEESLPLTGGAYVLRPREKLREEVKAKKQRKREEKRHTSHTKLEARFAAMEISPQPKDDPKRPLERGRFKLPEIYYEPSEEKREVELPGVVFEAPRHKGHGKYVNSSEAAH